VQPKSSESIKLSFGGAASSEIDASAFISEPAYSSAIVRRFEFSSALQRMSVVCKNEIDGKFRAFVKGSPEMIGALCLSHSLPQNFKEVLETYTKEGYRVIALAQKIMPEGFNYRKLQTI
jgi:P-type E1-E2 ATPase